MRKHPDKQPRRRDAIAGHYEPRIHPLRDNYQVLDWASEQSQQARFKVLADNVDLAGRTLLDVGAGLGDLWAYLKSRGIDARYTGVDILETMVDEARRRYGGVEFICADVFVNSPLAPRTFDVAFCSGIFNLNLGNNLMFLPLAVEKLLALSSGHVVFNLLHKRQTCTEERYFHYDPDFVFKMVERLNCHARLIDDYLPNDFTVILQRPKL